jgi:serine/threonine-protein kinase RsbW
MSAAETTSTRHDTVELTISARAENLAIARLALAGVAAAGGASRDVVADLKLAVTEACTNSIQHGYGGDAAENEILVRYTVGEGALGIVVEDQGRGFEPGDPSTNVVQNGQGHGGMGLMIIEMLTDELSVETTPAGTRIAFVKYFSPEI